MDLYIRRVAQRRFDEVSNIRSSPGTRGFRLATWRLAARRNAFSRWTDDRRVLQPGGYRNTELQNQDRIVLPRNIRQADRPLPGLGPACQHQLPLHSADSTRCESVAP